MPEAIWRPVSEAEAVGARAVVIEWLRAVHGIVLDGPAALAAWRHDRPAAFAAAISRFAGLDPLPRGGDGAEQVRAALLRGSDEREALVIGGRVWFRAELRDATPVPEPVAIMASSLQPADLPALVASHLLDAGTCPDTRLHWAGDPAEPWPLGAWLLGATLVLGEAAGAAMRAAPPGWRG